MNVIFHAVNRRRELKFLESLVAKHRSLFGVSEDEREGRKWTTAGVSTPLTPLSLYRLLTFAFRCFDQISNHLITSNAIHVLFVSFFLTRNGSITRNSFFQLIFIRGVPRIRLRFSSGVENIDVNSVCSVLFLSY